MPWGNAGFGQGTLTPLHQPHPKTPRMWGRATQPAASPYRDLGTEAGWADPTAMGEWGRCGAGSDLLGVQPGFAWLPCPAMEDLIPKPLSAASSGTPTLMYWGCSSAGMASTRRWALHSSAAAPSLNLASTRCASLPDLGGRKYCVRLSVLWPRSRRRLPVPTLDLGNPMEQLSQVPLPSALGWGWRRGDTLWRRWCGAELYVPTDVT